MNLDHFMIPKHRPWGMPAAPLRALGYTSAGGCFASIGRNGRLVESECGRQSGPTTIIYWEEMNKRTDDLAWSIIWHTPFMVWSSRWKWQLWGYFDLLWSLKWEVKQVVAGQTHWQQWDQSAKKESLWARWWRSDTHQAWDDSRLMGMPPAIRYFPINYYATLNAYAFGTKKQAQIYSLQMFADSNLRPMHYRITYI